MIIFNAPIRVFPAHRLEHDPRSPYPWSVSRDDLDHQTYADHGALKRFSSPYARRVDEDAIALWSRDWLTIESDSSAMTACVWIVHDHEGRVLGFTPDQPKLGTGGGGKRKPKPEPQIDPAMLEGERPELYVIH